MAEHIKHTEAPRLKIKLTKYKHEGYGWEISYAADEPDEVVEAKVIKINSNMSRRFLAGEMDQ